MAAALALLAGVPAAQAAGIVLEQGVVCVQPAGALACRDEPVRLPFYWDRTHPDRDGRARFTFEWRGDGLGGAGAGRPGVEPVPALFLPHAGNAFRVALNGVEVFALGAPGTRQHDSGKRPWLVTLPTNLLHADLNRLEITLEATAGRAAQLAPVTVGPLSEIDDAYAREHLWRVQLSAAMLWMGLVLGAMSLAAWWVQREPMFLSYAIAEFAWAARLADMFFVEMPLSWVAWGTGVAVAFGTAQLAMTHFFLNAVGCWHGRWKTGYWSYVAMWLAVVPVVAALESRTLWVDWVAFGTVGFVALALFVAWQGFRQRLHWRWLFAGFVLVSTVTGTMDVLEAPGSIYMHPTWNRLAWAAFSLALAALVARRLWHARQHELRVQDELRQALDAQARELEAANRQRAASELALAMQQERQRVMRDMHDVLGSRLSGLLSLAGRQDREASELQSEVRLAIDDLREVVDAMEPFDGNLDTMLAKLRPQLERRLSLAGVTLDWAVDDLPVADHLTPAQVQHLRRLLLEAANNVARHARATRAALAAHVRADAIEVELQDDGIGIGPTADRPPDAGTGNGLRNMQWRARELGATLSMRRDGGTRVTLRLPLPAPRLSSPPGDPA